MKFKKLASMAVVAAVIFSLAAPAFALTAGGGTTSGSGTTTSGTSSSADATANSQSVDVSTTVKTPTIKLEVSTTNEVIINPYQIAVTMDKKSVTDPIISTPFVLKNTSDCELELDVKATLTASTNVKPVAKLTSSGTDKEVVVRLLAVRTKDAKATNLALTSDGKNVDTANLVGTTVADKIDATDSKEYVSGVALLEAAGTEYGLKAGTSAVTLKLPQTDGQDKNANYVTFQFKGEVNGNAATPWAADDTISVKVVMNFTPKTPTEAKAAAETVEGE